MQSHAAELTYKLFCFPWIHQTSHIFGGWGPLSFYFVTSSLPVRWQSEGFLLDKRIVFKFQLSRTYSIFVCELHHLKFIKGCHPHHPHSSNAVDRHHSIPAPLCVSALSVTVTVITVEADHNLLILVLVFIKPDLYWPHIACFFVPLTNFIPHTPVCIRVYWTSL